MTTGDLAGWFTTAIGKVEFYWNFYVVTLLALIGWMLSTAGPATASVKWLITVGYLVFVCMNVLGLWNSYKFAEALRQDLLAIAPPELAKTRTVLAGSLFGGRYSVVLAIHCVLAIIVLVCVWTAPF